MIDDPMDVEQVEHLQRLVDKVYYQVRTPAAMKLRAAGSLLTGQPFTLPCFYSQRLQQVIDAHLAAGEVRAVICFCSSAAEYVFRSRHYPDLSRHQVLLADLVDVDSEKWRQYAQKRSGPMRWLYNREATRLLPCEQRIAAAFDRTFLVSEEEKGVLAQYGAVDKVEALPNGVDLDYFSPELTPQGATDPATTKLVFSGAMDYWPNIEGAVWFAREVFPAVRQAVPAAVFCIAGRNPDTTVTDLRQLPGIEVTGTIPDMRTHLASATLCVAPLMIARGIQNKVLEAMAMHKAVVATPGAATGLKAVPDEEIVVAENAAEMATQIIGLLKNPEKRQRIGASARRYVEREHCWDKHLGRLNELIEAGK
jgi:sugar transferase (PEP-CTERM/EpsH1 system associated)